MTRTSDASGPTCRSSNPAGRAKLPVDVLLVGGGVEEGIEILPVLYAPTGGAGQIRRNIFDYPPPPVVKPPPPPAIVKPPPPTVNLGSVSPRDAIAGTSRPITITLMGSLFPTDAQVLFGGQVIPSQRLSSTQIRATIPPSL